jgi:hypothetical protein
MALIHKEKKKVFVTDKIPFLVFIYENQWNVIMELWDYTLRYLN